MLIDRQDLEEQDAPAPPVTLREMGQKQVAGCIIFKFSKALASDSMAFGKRWINVST